MSQAQAQVFPTSYTAADGRIRTAASVLELTTRRRDLGTWAITTTLSGSAATALRREIDALPTEKQIRDGVVSMFTPGQIAGGWTVRTLLEHLDRLVADRDALVDLVQRFGPDAADQASASVTKRPVAVTTTDRRAAAIARAKAAETASTDPTPSPLTTGPQTGSGMPSWLPLAAIAAGIAAIIYWRTR